MKHVGLLIALLAPVVHAAAPTLTPLWEVAAGPTGAHAAYGWAFDGQGFLPFDGCVHVELDPQFQDARVDVVGWLNGTDQIRVRMNEYVGSNLSFEAASEAPAYAPFPAAPARALVRGTGRLEVDGNDFPDPVTGGDFELQAIVSQAALRDPATGAIHARSGQPYDAARRDDVAAQGPGQVHVILRGGSVPREDAVQQNESLFRPPEPQTALGFHEVVPLWNDRFGGEAELRVFFAPQGLPALGTDVRVVVLDPDQEILSETHLDAVNPSHELRFPLNKWGAYTVDLSGRRANSRLIVEATLHAPPSFLLNLWWSDASPSPQAAIQNGRCVDDLEGRWANANAPLETHVGPNEPPRLGLVAVIAGAAGAAWLALFVAKLVFQQRGAAAFQRTFRR